jgi:hypothetical protein
MLVLLAFAVAPGMALAQSLKSAIVGSWLVTSIVDRYDTGEPINNWGTPKGNITFDAAGRFSQIIIGDAEPALKGADPRRPDAPVVAYYGTYTVNEATKTVTFRLEAAAFSPRAGATLTSTVELKGGTMKIIGSGRKDQRGGFRPELEVKRAPAL